mgnify:FL=1
MYKSGKTAFRNATVTTRTVIEVFKQIDLFRDISPAKKEARRKSKEEYNYVENLKLF